MDPGTYFHFGVKRGTINALDNRFVPSPLSKIEILLNMDGVPISKSTKKEFWPVTAQLKGLNNNSPLVVGVYSGRGKPSDVNQFVKVTIDELNELADNGLSYENRIIPFSVLGFVCDAPARAFIKCIKNHSGFCCCERCVVHGEFHGRVVFLENDSPERTDDSFRNQLDNKDHHKDVKSYLETMRGLDMIKSFPLDYMHLVCLGVVRKMLNSFKSGSFQVRMKSADIFKISEFLLYISD